MPRRRVAVHWLAGVAACAVPGCGARLPETTRSVGDASIVVRECRFADQPPVIDGTLDEAAWQHVARGGPRLLWDREHLYLAADVAADGDGPSRAAVVWRLAPPAAERGELELRLSAADELLVRRIATDGTRPLDAAESGVQSAVASAATSGGRTIEMRIAWWAIAALAERPEPADQWRLVDTSAGRAATVRFIGPDDGPTRPFGIDALEPVTTSRVVGSPDPPLPYRTAPAFPAARISAPVTIAHQPGSDRLLYVTEPHGYAPSSLMRMRDDPAGFDPEVLVPADDSTVHYGIAFHPRFAENGFVYVGCNGLAGPDGTPPADGRKRTRVIRYRIDPDPPYAFHRESASVVIEWDSDGHNGGDLAFGPDGMLYVGSGDGTSDSDADMVGQDLSTLRAKILRIDVDRPDEGRGYSVPADNPFVGMPGVRPETWAYGLRQPWRVCVDRETGQVWVGNNGQDLWEQIYLVERGANYGWSVVEGSHPFNDLQTAGPHPIAKPVAEHSHAEARSMTGGLVYRGDALPELRGAYIYGDYSTGRIWGIRHDGRRVTWHELLADTTLTITGFGTDSHGEILIADHRQGDDGGFHRLVPAGPATVRPPFPRTLSESGLFADVAGHRMAAGVIPYGVNSPLWSDGTHKARFMALPPTVDESGGSVPAAIEVVDSRGWNFPDGTVLVKSFAIDRREGDPTSRRWIETRFMLKEAGQWAGYSYEWNDEQTDALLVPAEGRDRDFTIRTAAADRTLAWRYPSRVECMVCHSQASHFVLGLCTVQLNRDFDYAAVLGPGHATDNQLRTLEHLGVLKVDWRRTARALAEAAAQGRGLAGQEAAGWAKEIVPDAPPAGVTRRHSRLLAEAPEQLNRLVDPHDATADLAARARSYLQSNCASCHVPTGGGNAQIDLEYLTATETRPLDAMRAVGVKPMHHTYGLTEARLIAPSAPERSVLLARVARRGAGQMPQLATTVIDDQAVALLRAWIESLPPDNAAAAR